MRELSLQDFDALLKRLAIDGRIGDLRIARQFRQEFALVAVEVGSDHMAAVERDGEAAPRIADRNAENRSRQIARKTRVGRIDAANSVERESAAAEFAGEQPAGARERVGVRRFPPWANAPPEDAVLLAKERRRREAERMHRRLRQQALDVGEAVGALNRPAGSGELLPGVVKVP